VNFNLELAGHRVLITGGTKGVGAALVESLRDAGMTVVATARSVPDTSPGGVTYIAADLMTAKGCQAVADGEWETAINQKRSCPCYRVANRGLAQVRPVALRGCEPTSARERRSAVPPHRPRSAQQIKY